MENLSGKTIVLGITGGIAAYKSADICSRLVKSGASVHVVMTEHATKFISPVTFRALTGHQVITGLWDEPQEYEIAHVSLPDKADLVLIAPATANIIGKIANGIADDFLSSMVAATQAPVMLAPAMNCKMWTNPVVQANVERLKSLGYVFIGPESGHLACGTEGVGRMASPEEIVNAVNAQLGVKQDLAGVAVLVTAGPTEEPIDPVRSITNMSSGKMGYAIAEAAAERGAKVVLVSGPTSLPVPPSVEIVRVRTAEEMLHAVLDRLSDVQVVIGAAAVADYTPKSPAGSKVKKSDAEIVLELTPTQDIIAEVGRRKGERILVGFAAETENLIENARSKMEAKNLDLIVANDVSKPGIGFGSDVNEVTIIGRSGIVQEYPRLPKRDVGNIILDRVKEVLTGRQRS